MYLIRCLNPAFLSNVGSYNMYYQLSNSKHNIQSIQSVTLTTMLIDRDKTWCMIQPLTLLEQTINLKGKLNLIRNINLVPEKSTTIHVTTMSKGNVIIPLNPIQGPLFLPCNTGNRFNSIEQSTRPPCVFNMS